MLDKEIMAAFVRNSISKKPNIDTDKAKNDRIILAFNLKNIRTVDEIRDFGRKLAKSGTPENIKTVVFAAYPYIPFLTEQLRYSHTAVGAKDVAAFIPGTRDVCEGQVCADLLRQMACSVSIVGSCDRRVFLGESDQDVVRKVRACLAAGIRPYICIGETSEEFTKGQTEAAIKRQLGAVIDSIGKCISRTSIIYQPFADRKDGSAPDAYNIERTLGLIYMTCQAAGSTEPVILYGGELGDNSFNQLVTMDHMDGFLLDM